MLTALGGAASWRQLRAAGVGWYGMWLALQTGAVVRLRRGAHALPGADPSLCAAVTLGGLLACTTAAVSLGLPVLFTHGPHVVVPRGWSHARLDGARVHRRDLDPREKSGVTTSMLRTVVDCARELALREALVICDAALRAGLDQAQLWDAARAARGPGAARVREVARLADPRAESLVLEADGFAHHSGRDSYRNDRRRHNALVAAGFTLLRFSYEDVVHHEAEVADTIRRVLARGPRWRGTITGSA